MTRDPLVCDDPLAERRFAYAKAAAEEGDFNAAAEVLEQALERAPDWAAAWFALGEARERLGEIDAAAWPFVDACRRPADSHGAAARLALIGRGDARFPSRGLCRASVRPICAALRGASDRDARLPRPALIAEAMSAAAPGRRFAWPWISVAATGYGRGVA